MSTMFERSDDRKAAANEAPAAPPPRPQRGGYVTPNAVVAAATFVSVEILYCLTQKGILNREEVDQIFHSALMHCENPTGGEGLAISHMRALVRWDLRYRAPADTETR